MYGILPHCWRLYSDAQDSSLAAMAHGCLSQQQNFMLQCLIGETNGGDIELNCPQNLTHSKVRSEFRFVEAKSVRINSSQPHYRYDIAHLCSLCLLFVYYSNVSFRDSFIPTLENIWAKLSLLNVSIVICVGTSFALTWSSQWCKFLLKWL